MKSTMILAVALAAGLLFIGASISSVDAVKSSGNKNQQFGKSSNIQVCGTHFCASDPSLNKHVDHEKNKPTQDDLRALFNRMDKIHKQHQDQLLDKWREMTNAERVQFIKQMNKMMTKMESIDMATHMQQMLGDQHDASHTKMKDHVHKKTNTSN